MIQDIIVGASRGTVKVVVCLHRTLYYCSLLFEIYRHKHGVRYSTILISITALATGENWAMTFSIGQY